MRVRCKMKLETITMRQSSMAVYGDPENPKKVTGYKPRVLYDARFGVVYGAEGADDDSKRFWEATPSGHLEVATVIQMPWELGQVYYIDIMPVGEGRVNTGPMAV